MTASKQAELFDVWLVYLHFIDYPETGKVRPVLVVGKSDVDTFAVAKITSKPPQPGTGDIAIAQWQQAGLNVPSTVRCSQVFEIGIDELLRDKPIGALQPYDVDQVLKKMVRLGYYQLPELLE